MIFDKPTASSLERVAACPASAAIPVRVRASSTHAERGSEIHGFIEATLAKHETREAALAAVPIEWRGTCAALDWETLTGDLDPKSIHCESAFAVDYVAGSARLLGRSLGRNYPKTPDEEVTGTCDIDAMHLDGETPVVADAKTGLAVTPCAENWQMRFQSYAKHRTTGAPDVLGRIAYIAENGAVRLDEHLFEPPDHADTLDGIADIFRRVKEVRLDQLQVFPGEWCLYCPAYLACPAKTALVRQLAPELESIDQLVQEMTTQQIGAAWERLEQIKPLVKRLDAALKDAARSQIITLPDGRVLREIEKGKSSINGERALALAQKYGAPAEELAECTRRSTWTEIRATKAKVA